MDIIYNFKSIYYVLCLTKNNKKKIFQTEYLNKLLPDLNRQNELPFYLGFIFSEPISCVAA
jgi:hypothetical protein